MAILFNTTTDILKESSIINKDDCFADNPDYQFTTLLNSLKTDDEVFYYKPEMVPVRLNESVEGKKYIMEFDNIYKLMKSTNTGIVESMKSVCEENNIDYNDAYLLIESKNSIKNKMKNASKDTKKKLIKSIKTLKDKKVKILTKKEK